MDVCYVCSSFTPETVVVNIAEHRIVGQVAQVSPFWVFHIGAMEPGR